MASDSIVNIDFADMHFIYTHPSITEFSNKLIASELLMSCQMRQKPTPLTVITAASLRLRHKIVKSCQPLQAKL